MRLRAGRKRLLLPAFFVLLITTAEVAAAEPLLILSGGGSPADNAANHLENVRWLETLWAPWGPVWSLVADGTNPAPDAARPSTADPTAAFVQRVIMGTPETLEFVDSTARSIVGPATRAGLIDWVAVTGATLGPGAMLNVYVTDHGVREDGESRIVLWGDTIGPADLAVALDRLPSGVGVRFVMAQCYSGGFVDTVARLRAAGRQACGFFSTLPTRVAAGCRLDPEDTDWAEYTTAFFEPAAGVARSPRRKPPPKAMTWAEAHRHAVRTLPTVDVPVRSSEMSAVASRDDLPAPLDDEWRGRARPLTGSAALTEALDKLQAIEERLAADLLLRFPWLEYPFSPSFAVRWANERGAIGTYLAAQPDAAAYAAALAEVARRQRAVEAAERAEARILRRQWAEVAAVDGVGDAALLACEEAPLPGR